ncbi:retrovirus-related Pol polyprotein from type-2 retrotransposable element R2DM, partial [Nephila pilipes]
MPFDGVLEHNFIIAQHLEDAHRLKSESFACWIDISNAFGSIPHNVLWKTLAATGADHDFISICKDIYHDSTSSILSSSGITPPIPIRDGRRILAGPPTSVIITKSDNTGNPPNINIEFPLSSTTCYNMSSTENEAGPAVCGAPLVNDSLDDFIIKPNSSVAPFLSESEQPRSDIHVEVPFAPTLPSTRVPPAIDLDRVVDPYSILPEPLLAP